MKLSAKGIKILKVLHLICACAWIGGVLSILILYFTKLGVDDASVIVGVNTASRWIDIAIVIIPGAYGCLFTGLAYSLCTTWGFAKHRWILLKWCMIVILMATGTFFLGPWEASMLEMSTKLGNSLFTDPTYQSLTLYHFVGGTLQLCGLFFMVYLSVFRPFKKDKSIINQES